MLSACQTAFIGSRRSGTSKKELKTWKKRLIEIVPVVKDKWLEIFREEKDSFKEDGLEISEDDMGKLTYILIPLCTIDSTALMNYSKGVFPETLMALDTYHAKACSISGDRGAATA